MKSKFVRPVRSRYMDGINVKMVHTDITIRNAPDVNNPGATYPFSTSPGLILSNSTTPGGQVINYLGSNTTNFQGGFLFRLGNALQWKQFNTMYDRVKLNGVKLQFIPSYNTGVVSDVVASTLPSMKYVYDFDDANPSPSSDSLWARQGKTVRLNKPFSIYIKPRVRTSVQAITQGTSPVIIAGKSERSGFLDTANASDIAHFGIKFGVKDWTVDAPLTLRVVVTYYVSFRQLIWNAPPKAFAPLLPEEVYIPEEEIPCEEVPEELKS